MSKDIITVRVHASTKKVGSEVYDEFEAEREVWDAMSEDEKEQWRLDVFWNMVDCWAEEL